MTDPGFYPDTENEGGQRYFDGENWTDDRTPPGQPEKSGLWQSFRAWPMWAQVLSWVGVGVVALAVIGGIGQAVAPPEQEVVVVVEEESEATAPEATAVPTPAAPVTTAPTTTTAPPTTAPPVVTAAPPVATEKVLVFANCTDAKSQGYSNILRGEPGYASKLDRDNDGIACET